MVNRTVNHTVNHKLWRNCDITTASLSFCQSYMFSIWTYIRLHGFQYLFTCMSIIFNGLILVKKPPGSWRDLGGIPPGFPPGPAEILAAGISVPRRESRRDPTGIPAGSCRDFGRRDFRSPPWIPAGSWRDYHRDPAEILAAGISLRAESAGGITRRDFGRRVFAPRRESRRDPGGITTGIPPRFWPPGFRFAPRIPAGN